MSANEARLARFEIAIALSIALVSITTAVVAGRASAVGSAAGDASRRGLIDAIRQQATMSENWRLVYQEAAFAQEHVASAAELDVLAESSDTAEQIQTNEVAENLLPSLARLSPFVTDARYRRADGSLDLDLRFQDVEAESPDLAALSPETSFREADRRLSEQRGLTMGSILLVISLFWLTLAEIAKGRTRSASFAIGLLIYVVSLVSLALVEGIYVLTTLGGAQ